MHRSARLILPSCIAFRKRFCNWIGQIHSAPSFYRNSSIVTNWVNLLRLFMLWTTSVECNALLCKYKEVQSSEVESRLATKITTTKHKTHNQSKLYKRFIGFDKAFLMPGTNGSNVNSNEKKVDFIKYFIIAIMSVLCNFSVFSSRCSWWEICRRKFA